MQSTMLVSFLLLSSLLSGSFALPSETTIDTFKAANEIVPTETLDLQELRGGGISTASAGFIDIIGATPYTVAPGRSAATGRLSRGFTSSGQPFLVVRDNDFKIRRIVVRLEDNSITTFRRVDDAYFAEVSDNVERTVEQTFTGNDAKAIPTNLRNLLREKTSVAVPAQQDNRELQSACTDFYEIEIAIGYDSTFCDDYDNQLEAETTIENIVAQASLQYEQPGLCAQITIVDLEGFCDSTDDPYYDLWENGTGESGCTEDVDGMLQYFSSYWRANKSSVARDIAHLFQGRLFTDGDVVGCAYLSAFCGTFAYGVNRFSWTTDETRQAILFAHELGHNAGADHVPLQPDVQYIMEPILDTKQSDGFATVSKNVMEEFISDSTCITQVPIPTPPGPPTSQEPSSFPTEAPSAAPVPTPSAAPTATESAVPTGAPSVAPIEAPSAAPIPTPSAAPTVTKSAAPTGAPSSAPSAGPTVFGAPPTPSKEPSAAPTEAANPDNNAIFVSAYVRFYFRPLREDPGEAVTAQFVTAVGEMVCRHLGRRLRRYFRPQTISIPSCTYTPEPGSSLTSSPFAMEFEFTVRFEDSDSRAVSAAQQKADVDDAVEQAFIGEAEEELVAEMQTLPDENPLAESSGVALVSEASPEVEEDAAACIMLPDFFLAIPILGSLLNALLCALFGIF